MACSRATFTFTLGTTCGGVGFHGAEQCHNKTGKMCYCHRNGRKIASQFHLEYMAPILHSDENGGMCKCPTGRRPWFYRQWQWYIIITDFYYDFYSFSDTNTKF